MSDLDHHLPEISAGDPDAFASWVAAAEPRIRGSLRRFATQVDTEVVLQECLLRVWQVAPRFRPDGRPDGLLRLAFRIARNLAVTELRRPGVTPTDPHLLEEAGETLAVPPAPPDDPRLRAVIDECRERLPSKPRAAFDARLGVAPDADRDRAKRLGMTLNTFLQNVRRARLALVECLERHGVKLGDLP